MLEPVAVIATIRHSWHNFGKHPGPQEEILTVVFPLVVVTDIKAEVDAVVKKWIESEWPTNLSELSEDVRDQFWWSVTSFKAAKKLEVWNG